MNVQGLNLPNNIGNFATGNLYPGQRFLIEVLQLNESGRAVIKINGEFLEAVLESEAQPGDKFWAVIKNVGTREIVLSKDVAFSELPVDRRLSKGQIQPQVREPVPDQEVLQALQHAQKRDWGSLTHSKSTTPLLPQSVAQTTPEALLTEKLINIIPHWPELNGENGRVLILNFLRWLGMDYERILVDILRFGDGTNGDGPDVDSAKLEEIAWLKNTLKGQLLELLSLKDYKTSASKIQELLEKITGQQLWLQNGGYENPYIWLNLPLRLDHHVYDAKIAFQSGRRKNKLDISHCRIGVYIETPALGKIGVDAYLLENSLSLRLMTVIPQEISELVKQLTPEMKIRFAGIGLNLTALEVVPFVSDAEFESFVSGEPRQGVDIYA